MRRQFSKYPTNYIKASYATSEFEIIECTTRQEIEGLGSALTFEGFDLDGGDLEFLDQWLESHGCELKAPVAYLIKGETMNNLYNLTGNNRYPADLNIVCIDLNNITGNLGGIITARFAIGGRWLDDVIANNVSRELEKNPGDDDDYYM